MSELLEIIISAVDQASDVFQGIGDTVGSTADELQTQFEQATAEVEQLEQELAAIYMGDVEGDAEAVEAALASAEEEAQRLADAIDNVEQESGEAGESIDAMADLMSFQQISEWVTQLADAMWQVADKAGTVQDSWTRLGLAAEGANIPVDQMKNSVSQLSSETGRAGGTIRESFIAMSSAGVTSMEAMQTAFKGASAQSFILGTDVESLVNKFSGMAMKSSIAERTLKGTGITVEELGSVLGIQGATIDDVNAKWETMDTDARMAALGQAAAMNEGKDANDAYKNSWEGLQAQIDIAKGKIEVLAGKVFLPVLIPVMEAAARVLDWLGNTIGAVMDGPLGGFISVIGSLAGGLVLLLAGVTAISAGMGFFSASLLPAIAASWALVAPWLPFIAIGAAIIAIIYEVGKAFGWWTDASSMIDAIGAGLQRLWNAFINHPDVQAAISAISGAISVLWGWIQQAGQAIMDFFGISTGGDFDIVRALIDGIGNAWNMLKMALGPVIAAVQNIINVFNLFRSGQMDLPQFIWSVLTILGQMYVTIFTRIGSFVVSIGIRLVRAGVNAARNFVTGIITRLRQLPGRVFSALIAVVSRIISAGAQWVSTVKQKALDVVNGAYNTLTSLPGKIASALSGVVDAITQPFKKGYEDAKAWWDKMTQLKMPNFYAGEPLDITGNNSLSISSSDNGPIIIEDNINLTVDLKNIPAGMSADTLITALQDKNVLNALVSNRDFQSLDAQVKQKISLKKMRSGGI
jgi:hypothetical protein